RTCRSRLLSRIGAVVSHKRLGTNHQSHAEQTQDSHLAVARAHFSLLYDVAPLFGAMRGNGLLLESNASLAGAEASSLPPDARLRGVRKLEVPYKVVVSTRVCRKPIIPRRAGISIQFPQ